MKLMKVNICKVCIYGELKKFFFKYKRAIFLGVGLVTIIAIIYFKTRRKRLRR